MASEERLGTLAGTVQSAHLEDGVPFRVIVRYSVSEFGVNRTSLLIPFWLLGAGAAIGDCSTAELDGLQIRRDLRVSGGGRDDVLIVLGSPTDVYGSPVQEDHLRCIHWYLRRAREDIHFHGGDA